MKVTQIEKMIRRVAKEDLSDGDVVDVSDINDLIISKCGKSRWSNREISGSINKVIDIYIPCGINKSSGLKQYMVQKA